MGRPVKRPWFKLYIADWNMATSVMTLEEQGAYMRLLTLQWRDEKISTEPKRVARALGVTLDHYQQELEPMVLSHFPDGVNPRLKREWIVADEISEQAADNGRKGANKTNGGRRNSADPSAEIPPRRKSGNRVGEKSASQRSETEKANTSAFDLELVYQHYPRKKGKSKGLEKLEQLIKNQADFDRLMCGVIAFAQEQARDRTELKFIPYFSTWVSDKVWLDYAEKSPASGPLSGESKRLTLEERIKAREEAEHAAAVSNARQQQPGLFPDSPNGISRQVESNGARNLPNGESVSGGRSPDRPPRTNSGVGG